MALGVGDGIAIAYPTPFHSECTGSIAGPPSWTGKKGATHSPSNASHS